jgi:hypothetical protein
MRLIRAGRCAVSLYVGSGYALFGGMPGNVLLAYSIDGK